jgi:NAD(P)-dependent dehydrogenase (short-subunit alcohol dehydrogenase family)
MEKFALNGKVAFVTGGCGLIGEEICWALSQAGAFTVILDLDEKKGRQLESNIIQKGFRCEFVKFDITDFDNIDYNIDKLFSKFKTLDVWINNAYPRTSDWGNKLEDLVYESWRKNIDMHLNAYALLSRKVALKMIENAIKGSIINFGSIYGIVGNDFTIYEDTGLTSPMAYAAIKGGIINLSRYLASYFGKYGIRINSLCPGGIFNNQNETFVENFSKKCPLKRMGNAEEIAAPVLFLASDASSYITGSTLIVDGGWTAI